jgi:excinuclease UvrABC helicase subunit UvrB
MRDSIEALYEMDYVEVAELADKVAEDPAAAWEPEKLRGEIERIRADMMRSAEELRFEDAARLRDRLKELERLELKR